MIARRTFLARTAAIVTAAALPVTVSPSTPQTLLSLRALPAAALVSDLRPVEYPFPSELAGACAIDVCDRAAQARFRYQRDALRFKALAYAVNHWV